MNVSPKNLLLGTLGLIRFVPIYLVEMTKSNFKVALDTFRPRPHFSPAFVDIDLAAYGPVQRYGAACLISMTPGTLSLDMEEGSDILVVHCLYAEDEEATRQDLLKLLSQAFGPANSHAA